ncbi:centrosomin isoform X4 [Drosophila ficusphila]|uniref:centrosomin isoform X4 n=1 Tax=Drosophila ficusphila TaxID=30025 RepID=UPI0007E7C711|nr:centrosomin isoform X4 [Drosophila ficusphila]
MDQSKQVLRDYCGDGNNTCASSLREITLIETVTSFLEENGASEIDRKVLKKLAEALSKSIDITSPGALQDVTMENSYASFDAVRPQSGNHSPMAMQGRPVRELEEQMSSLRKENFNLKLRIYFMEEGQPGNRTNNSSDSLSKQLIDAKIEIEMLRKTVDEKMELLKDAARAISHHEDVQRKAELESQMLIEELQEQIRSYQLAESSQAGGSIADPDTRKIQRLESEMKKLEDELQQVITQNTEAKNEMEFALAERLETITACEAKIRELAIKNAELVERLEKDSEIAESSNKIIEELKSEIGECRANNQDLVASISSMDVELVRRSNSMKEVSNTMDVQRQTIQLLEGTIKSKEKSNARLLNSLLEFEALTTKQNAELEIMRQQNVYFRDLSDNLQQKELRQSDRGVAIVQPMPTMTTDAAGVGIKSSLDRCGSTSSLHSNFSSISVLCGSRGPSSRKTLCHWNGGQQQQQHHHHQAYPTPQYLQQRGHRHGRHTTLMAVSAPSTAFYNYSLPSFTGFRQFLWRWGT